MRAPENPSAFPLATTCDTIDHLGMTLRDWFAGQALTGLVASAQGQVDAPIYAEGAYAIADAMLAMRGRS